MIVSFMIRSNIGLFSQKLSKRIVFNGCFFMCSFSVPMRGIPTTNTCKLSAGFTNEPRRFPRQLPKRGGAKLLDIQELPQALKIRRKEQEAEEKARKQQEKEEQKKRLQAERAEKVSVFFGEGKKVYIFRMGYVSFIDILKILKKASNFCSLFAMFL